MVKVNEPANYQSYLLRCWRVSLAVGDRPARWRFALREVSEEPVERGFDSLEELFVFLSGEREINHVSAEDGSDDE